MAIAYRNKNFTSGSAKTSLVFSAPAGLTNDDILLCCLGKGNENALTVPAGFSAAVSIVASDASFTLYYSWKRAASESGTYTFSWTGSVFAEGILAAYSGATLTGSPLDVTPTKQANGSETNKITCPSITTITTNTLVIPFGANYTYIMSAATLAGYTIREQTDIAVLADTLQANPGASGAPTYIHARGAAQTAGITIALRTCAFPDELPLGMNKGLGKRITTTL